MGVNRTETPALTTALSWPSLGPKKVAEGPGMAALEHGGRSRVSIGSCQDSGAGTVLGESSRPANNAGKRVGAGCDRRQQAVVRDVIGEDAAIGQVDRQRGSIA